MVTTTEIDADHFLHVAEMSGLKAGATYDYQVWSGSTVSATFTFRAAPEIGTPVDIAWVADTQDGYSVFAQHVEHIAARAPDMLVAPGDLVHMGWPHADVEAYLVEAWHEQWFEPLQTETFAQTTPVMAARGNHDAEHAMSYAYTALPGNEAWYTYTFGNVFFVVLDTEAPTRATGTEVNQKVFLEKALKSDDALNADWRVVTFHRPPYTNARHDRTSTGSAEVQGDWVDLFETLDVDLVVCGHKHSYQQGVQNGVRYVIVGGGGAELDDEIIDLYSFLDVVELTWHYAVMEAGESSLVWTTYDADDNVVDTFTLEH